MQSHAITCNHMQSHAITCDHMQSHAITCNHMQSHAITCNHMQSHSHLWDRGDGREESLRLLTSQCRPINGVHHYVDVRRQCTRRRATVRERARGRGRRDACTGHPTRTGVTTIFDKVECVW